MLRVAHAQSFVFFLLLHVLCRLACPSPATQVPRNSLGPLTTTFAHPSECWNWGIEDYTASLQQGCTSSSLIDTIDCWPPIPESIVEARSILSSEHFYGLGFYSPGFVCPTGYTSACTQIQPPSGELPSIEVDVSFDFQYPLEPGETAIGCCPK